MVNLVKDTRLRKKHIKYKYISHIAHKDRSLNDYYKRKGLYRGNFYTRAICWLTTFIVLAISIAIPIHYVLLKNYYVLFDWTISFHIYNVLAILLTIMFPRTRLKNLFYTAGGSLLLTGVIGVGFDFPIHMLNIGVAMAIIILSLNNYNYRANTITKMMYATWILLVSFLISFVKDNFDTGNASLGGISGKGEYYEGLMMLNINIQNIWVKLGVFTIGFIFVIWLDVVWDRVLDYIYKHTIMANIKRYEEVIIVTPHYKLMNYRKQY